MCLKFNNLTKLIWLSDKIPFKPNLKGGEVKSTLVGNQPKSEILRNINDLV